MSGGNINSINTGVNRGDDGSGGGGYNNVVVGVNIFGGDDAISNSSSSSSSVCAHKRSELVIQKDMLVFMYISTGISAIIVLFAVFQLIRIRVRLWQLRNQSRRRNFLAKRLFHAFLCLAFLVNVINTVFDLTSFCFTDPLHDEAWWCFPVDAMLKRLSSFLSFAAYLTTLLFWTEFVYCINHNAATGEYFVKYKALIISLAVFIAAVFVIYVIMIFSYHDGICKKKIKYAYSHRVCICACAYFCLFVCFRCTVTAVLFTYILFLCVTCAYVCMQYHVGLTEGACTRT